MTKHNEDLHEVLAKYESAFMRPEWQACFGYYLLQISASFSGNYISDCVIHKKWLLNDKQNHNNNLSSHIVVNFAELPIKTESIDMLIVPHVLEQYKNIQKLLEELARITMTNGNIYIFVFMPRFFTKKILAKKLMKINFNWQALRKLTELRKLFNEYDLNIVEQYPIKGATNILAKFNLGFFPWFARLKWRLTGKVVCLKIKKNYLAITPIKPIQEWRKQCKKVLITQNSHREQHER